MAAHIPHRQRSAFTRFGFACLILTVGARLAGAAEPTPQLVIAGVYTVAPFVMADSAGPRGPLIDFFDREIAPRMGVRFQWTMPTTVARLEQNLIGGLVTFTPILARTPARERAGIVFAGDAYVRFEPCIAVLPESALNAITSPADLAGMTIGWVQSAALPEFLRDARLSFELIGSVDWAPANLEKLRLGRIQGAFFSDQFTARHFAAQKGLRVKLLKIPGPGAGLYGAFAPAAPTQLVERYRRAVHLAIEQGRWEAYMGKLPPAK
ncbi:ABC-type amino acid transport substrate-binding protein [Oxalobacteraceae bacterium GrIS 1.11]